MPILNAEMYHKEAELDNAQRKLADTRDDWYEETQVVFIFKFKPSWRIGSKVNWYVVVLSVML